MSNSRSKAFVSSWALAGAGLLAACGGTSAPGGSGASAEPSAGTPRVSGGSATRGPDVVGTSRLVPVTAPHSLAARAPTPPAAAVAAVAPRISSPVLRGDRAVTTSGSSGSCSLGAGTPTYYGGALVQRPKVFVYYWSGSAPFQGELEPFYAAITNSPFLDWMKEYDAQNHANTDVYAIRRGSWIGSFVDTGAQATGTITVSNVASRIAAMAGTNGVPSPDADTIYAVQIPSTLTVSDDRNGQGDSCTKWCGIHGSNYPTPLRFTIVVQPGTNCGCEDGSGNWLNEAEETASHELAETITDPDVFPSSGPVTGRSGWVPEIGDPCNFVTETVEDFPVQKIWSNHSQAGIVLQPSLQLVTHDAFESNIPVATFFDGTLPDVDFYAVEPPTSGGGSIYEGLPLLWASQSCYHLGYPLLSGDFNGDGYTDLGTYCGATKDWNAALNYFDEHGTWTTLDQSTGFGNNQADPIFTGDFNGDGKTDMGFFNWPDGTVWFGLSNGSSITWSAAAHIGSGQSNQNGAYPSFAGDRVVIADYNGDGRSDFGLLHVADGSIWVGTADASGEYLHDGTETGGVLEWLSPSAAAAMGSAVLVEDAIVLPGHFASTSRTDILFYVNTTGKWFVVPSTGSGFGAPVLFANTYSSFGPFLTADWFTVSSGMWGSGYDSVFFYHNDPQSWILMANSGGSAFTASMPGDDISAFGSLTGDIYATYPKYNQNAGGIVFYDNKNEYFAQTFLTTGGGFEYWLWYGSPSWASQLGNMYGQ
jgi:hypothetical protein